MFWIKPVEELRKGQETRDPGVITPSTQQPPDPVNDDMSEAKVCGSEASARVASGPESTLHEV